jgi:GDP-mannose 6-dehydrogenase
MVLTSTGKLVCILEQYSEKTEGKEFSVCINPEFMKESTAIHDFYFPPKKKKPTP